LVERAPEKREVTGSTPVPTTIEEQVRGIVLWWDSITDQKSCPLRALKD
jgi:hypothetical protein